MNVDTQKPAVVLIEFQNQWTNKGLYHFFNLRVFTPGFFTSSDLFLDRGPILCYQKRFALAIEHLSEHLKRDRKREFIGFEKFPGRRIPAANHGLVLAPGQIVQRPNGKAAACGTPRRHNHFRIIGYKGRKLVQSTQRFRSGEKHYQFRFFGI